MDDILASWLVDHPRRRRVATAASRNALLDYIFPQWLVDHTSAQDALNLSETLRLKARYTITRQCPCSTRGGSWWP